MSEMIERVARVIESEERGLTPHGLARATILAMRIPTPEMMAAGAKKVRGGSANDCAAACWRAMIVEILKD
jgi:hypothetical protein